MAAFGLGTFPAMLLMGGVGRWTQRIGRAPGVVVVAAGFPGAGGLAQRIDWRRQGVRVAGGFIVLLGLVTVMRGVLPMGAHLHGS
jgi:hypothetical protein